MSQPDHSGAHPRSEDDRVDSRSVLLVGFGALAIFLAAAGTTIAWVRHSNAVTPQAALPPEVGQSKIGLVEQQLFDTHLRGARDRAAQQARLDGFGWVDREAGVLHIPIATAMELVARGVRVPAGEAPPPPPIGAANGGVDAPGATPAAAPGQGTGPAPSTAKARGGKRQ
jgi:hypothetical protein